MIITTIQMRIQRSTPWGFGSLEELWIEMLLTCNYQKISKSPEAKSKQEENHRSATGYTKREKRVTYIETARIPNLRERELYGWRSTLKYFCVWKTPRKPQQFYILALVSVP